MSNHDEDEHTITVSHPLFPHTHLSEGTGTSNTSNVVKSVLKSTLHSSKEANRKEHDMVSPGSNRGVADLLRSLNASFAEPSTSRTQSLSSSVDEPSLPQVGLNSKHATLDHNQSLSARKSNEAVASTPSVPLQELESPTPSKKNRLTVLIPPRLNTRKSTSAVASAVSTPLQEPEPPKQYPLSILIRPRKVDAARSSDRLFTRSINRSKDDQSTAFYRANLDESEAWSDASVSSVVFKRPLYQKNPPVEQLRSITRVNLKPLAGSIATRSGSKASSSAQYNGPSRYNDLSAAAKPEMTRSARCNLIINEIFASDQRIDEGTSSNIPSRSSLELDNTAADVSHHSSPNVEHNLHSVFDHLTPQPSRTSLSSSNGDLESRLPPSLPFHDLPVSPPVQIPSLQDTPDRRSHSSKQGSPSRGDPIAGLTFAINPHSALHQKLASFPGEKDIEQSSELHLSGPDLSRPISPFPEPFSEVEHHASIPLLSPPHSKHEISNSLVPSPLATTPQFQLYEAMLPEHLEAPEESLSTLEPEVDGLSAQSLTDNQDPSNIALAPSEELIEIISPMVLEEQHAVSSRLHSPAHNSFDPLLASSLLSSSGAHFISFQDGASGLQPPLRANGISEPTTQNDEGIVFDETEFINFDPTETESSTHLPQPDPIFLSTPAPDKSQSITSDPVPILNTDASSSQDPPRISLHAIPSPPSVKVDLPAPMSMAHVEWVDVDVISEEETSETFARHRKNAASIVLDPGYLKPRYRNLWAPDDRNPYLQCAKNKMIIGKIRTDLEMWYDGPMDTQNASDEEELDELENEVESEDEDLEIEDSGTEMVLLSQDTHLATPTRKRRKISGATMTRTLPTSDNPELLPIESVSALGSNNRSSLHSHTISLETLKNRPGRKRKRQGSLDGPDIARDSLGGRVVRWESLLFTFIKGKKKFEREDLLDLKQVFQDIRASAAYISPASSLVDHVGVIADMDQEDVPMNDELGLRALAKELVQTWV